MPKQPSKAAEPFKLHVGPLWFCAWTSPRSPEPAGPPGPASPPQTSQVSDTGGMKVK